MTRELSCYARETALTQTSNLPFRLTHPGRPSSAWGWGRCDGVFAGGRAQL